MDQPEVFKEVLRFLDSTDIAYAVVGSVAAMSYGESRSTIDMDVLADVRFRHVPLIVQAFPDPDWYASEIGIKDAIRHRSQFNIVRPFEGDKVDVMLPKTEAHMQTLERASVRPIQSEFTGKVAHPNDIILGKLEYYAQGASQKHLTDISKMVRLSRNFIDFDEIALKAAKLGVAKVWQAILENVANMPPLPPDFPT